MKTHSLSILLYVALLRSSAGRCNWNYTGSSHFLDVDKTVGDYFQELRRTVEHDRYPYQKLEDLAGRLSPVLSDVELLVDFTAYLFHKNANALTKFRAIIAEIKLLDAILPNVEHLYSRVDSVAGYEYAVMTWKCARAAIEKAHNSIVSLFDSATAQNVVSKLGEYNRKFCPMFPLNFALWMASISNGSNNLDGRPLHVVMEREANKSRKLFADWSKTFFVYAVRAALLNHTCMSLNEAQGLRHCAPADPVNTAEYNQQLLHGIAQDLRIKDAYAEKTWWDVNVMSDHMDKLIGENPTATPQELAEIINKTLSEKFDWVKFSVTVRDADRHEIVAGFFPDIGRYLHDRKSKKVFINYESPQTKLGRTANRQSVEKIKNEMVAYFNSLPNANRLVIHNGCPYFSSCLLSLDEVVEKWDEKLAETAAGVACYRSRYTVWWYTPLGSVINYGPTYVYERECSHEFKGQMDNLIERCVIAY